MSDKQQTAVDWLLDQLSEQHTPRQWDQIIQQARAMFEAQMTDAYAYGMGETSQWNSIDKMFNQYYKDTFK